MSKTKPRPTSNRGRYQKKVGAKLVYMQGLATSTCAACDQFWRDRDESPNMPFGEWIGDKDNKCPDCKDEEDAE